MAKTVNKTAKPSAPPKTASEKLADDKAKKPLPRDTDDDDYEDGVLPHISMLPGAISCLIYFAPGLS
ncbi:hypothetical protein [Bradyrhizobium diazoefficiens]|uniref:hypothetical protein n=1 Tax=Bradyrhizobium diazoefficiens TaxID=1355477 RepID=UPI0027150097|nr:hypothetical protein [Bradyrhizobium diazoefficiens]WLC16996.1 hypothetical protein QIH76_00825 [Bradyrhizobium diazoefficiens]